MFSKLSSSSFVKTTHEVLPSTHHVVRYMSSSGIFTNPNPVGEKMPQYSPGSPERLAVEQELQKVTSKVHEIPCIVGGKEYFTGNTHNQVMCTDHKHVLAKVHKADAKLLNQAITVSQAARKEWANMPWNHRAMVFRKAAELIAGKYRYQSVATTMVGAGKNVWQAEIDAGAEQVDFLRLNNNFLQDIYKVQPLLNSNGVWNRLEYRELEGFIAAISPFNFTAIGANLSAVEALSYRCVAIPPDHEDL
jgi:1-pyrroline-5-carboxylate dehydrogenase